MSGCDINDVHARGRHRAVTEQPWLARFVFTGGAVAASAGSLWCSYARSGFVWLLLALTAVLLAAYAATYRWPSFFRLRSLTPHTPAAAGGERGRGDVPVLRVTDAGGRALVGRGVERRGLRYRLLEARALRAERRTGWASARRARTTPIDDE